jgi:hypothetical protein
MTERKSASLISHYTYKAATTATAPSSRVVRLNPVFRPAPVAGTIGELEALGVAAQVVPSVVPYAPALDPAGVVLAGTGVGEPAPRPTEQDVVPPVVNVLVVSWTWKGKLAYCPISSYKIDRLTCGTVTVVIRVVVKLLAGTVRPEDTPVV